MKSHIKHPKQPHRKNFGQRAASGSHVEAGEKPVNIPFIQSPVQVTVSLLVSNNKKTIRQCLDSIKPLLEKLPSELIIVDTGSTDGSVDIAREYTDKIISFPWQDDFAAARNAGLEQAEGEWFIFLDDDEWFEDIGPLVRFFQFHECDGYARAAYIQRNYTVKDGSAHNDIYLPRVVRRTKQMAFEGRVYESLVPAYGPVKLVDCFVHHYGLTPDDGQLRRKTSRNIPLLEREVEEHSQEMRYYVQLIRELMTAEDFDKAIETAEKTLSIPKKLWRQLEMSWIVAAVVSCYYQKGDYEKCMSVSSELLLSGITTDLATATIRYDRMLAEDHLENHQGAVDEAVAYLTLAKSLVENPTALNRQRYLYLDTVLQDGSVLFAQYTLAVHLKAMDRFGDALDACKGMFYAETELPEAVAWMIWEMSCQAGDFSNIQRFYEKCGGRASSVQVFFKAAEIAKERFPELVEPIMEALCALKDENPYLVLTRMVRAHSQGDLGGVRWGAEWFIKEGIPPVAPYDVVIPMAMIANMDIRGLIAPLTKEQWAEVIESIAGDPSGEALKIMKDYYASQENFEDEKMAFWKEIMDSKYSN